MTKGNTITRKEFMDSVYASTEAEKLNLTRNEVKGLTDLFFDKIKDILIDLKPNGRLEIRGIGSFIAKTRAPRKARNPKTGEAVSVKAKKTITFKLGSEIKATLNGKKAVEKKAVAPKKVVGKVAGRKTNLKKVK